jgi:membrane fusion protein (multidrug efflux system)
MFAEISIKPRSVEDSLVIPAGAVAGTGDDRYVFAIDGNTAKRVKVRVAPIDAESVELLEGLPVGTRIVASGLGKLSDGAALEVEP